MSRYMYPLFHLLNCGMSTKSGAQISSILLTITHRRVNSLLIGLPNSSASFSCQFSLDSSFPFLNHRYQVFVLYLSYYGPKTVPTVFHYRVQHQVLLLFYDLVILALFVMFTHRIIKIMLHCNGICFSGWFVIYLKYFASIFVIFQLFVKWIVGSSVFVSRKSENWLWFW